MSTEEKDAFALCIIQSLKEDEMLTGSLLIDDLLKYKKFQEEFLTLQLSNVKTKDELWIILKDLKEKVENKKWHIVIHFETHGNASGMVLSSDELVPWRELLEHLRPINVLLKHYLVVHLGMCNGAWIAANIDPYQRAPFRAIVASMREVGERDLLQSFTAFYDRYFFEISPRSAVDEMNRVFSEPGTFLLVFAEQVFDRVTNPDADPENFSRIAYQSAVSLWWPDSKLHHIPFETYRETHEKRLKKDFTNLKKNRDYFVMKDLKK